MAAFPHAFVGFSLEFLEVVSLVAELPVLETVAAVPLRFPHPVVLIQGHETTLTVLAWHSVIVSYE